MEITYEEYKQECLDDIHLEAQIDGTTYDDYFLTDTLGKLVAMGELIDPLPLCVNKKGRNNRQKVRCNIGASHFLLQKFKAL